MVLKCLHLLCRYLSANFPFLSQLLAYFSFLGNLAYLARTLMHDVAVEFACAVRMHRNN